MWSGAGGELFYRIGHRMMVVDVETEPTLTVSPPEELWEETCYGTALGIGVRQCHVAPDGRFLMITPDSAETDDATASPDLILVQNGFEELKRLVPVD